MLFICEIVSHCYHLATCMLVSTLAHADNVTFLKAHRCRMFALCTSEHRRLRKKTVLQILMHEALFFHLQATA